MAPRFAKSADHLDAPAAKADHTADVNDLYSWMEAPAATDAGADAGDAGPTGPTRAVFALTVFPAAPAGALFSDKVQYVIHTTSSASFGAAETNKDIICTFAGTAAPQTISCWVGGNDAYVTGNADTATGISSADGKLKVFAGLRKDPFFFNLAGFQDTVQTVKDAVDAGGVTFDDAGCPQLDTPTSDLLKAKLSTTNGGPAVDFFKDLKTLAIVVSVDKALVTTGGPIVSSWASTNQGQ